LSTNAAAQESGLFASLRGLLKTAVALLRTRLELLATELEEEKLRLLSLLAYGVAASFFLGCAAVMLAIFFIVLFWDTHRLQAIASIAGVFLCGSGVAILQIRRLIRKKSTLFAASLAELASDHAALQGDSGGPHGN